MTKAPQKSFMSTLPILFALIAGGLGIYWFQSPERKAASDEDIKIVADAGGLTKSLATGALAAFLVHREPKPIAPLNFTSGTGEVKSLADWSGKVVLVNLWATWCAPCRKEMPDLAKLQQQLGGPDFEVVAISVDRKGAEASAAFLKEAGADQLGLYVDPSSKVLSDLQALGLPATVLLDRRGQELGRLLGPADWASVDAVNLIKAAMALK